ncbi:MAG: hypothetical protein HF962_04345 [Sulfurovum sp.]|nr:hypothetical protein [Sulfurovum sp.]
MKQLLRLVLAGVAVLALNGCSTGDTDTGNSYKDYYITKTDGSGVKNIVWNCDSGTNGTTNSSGKFYTESNDNCDLDLRTNLITGDIFLEGNRGDLQGVRYRCIGNSTNPSVDDFTLANGYIDNASRFASCTLYNLP